MADAADGEKVEEKVGSEEVDVVAQLREALAGALADAGMEVDPMLVGWYNELVSKKSGDKYVIDAPDDCVAFVVSSTPAMFEAFRVAYGGKRYPSDPVDSWAKDCIQEAAASVAKRFPAAVGEGGIEFISEGWDRARGQATVLVQTAAHAAGTVYFYQDEDVKDRTWLDAWQERQAAAGKPTKVFPVAIHPRFGGWFALRGVYVLRSLRRPAMTKPPTPDPLPTDEARSTALIKYNDGWLDRDIGMECEARYSDLAVEYFSYLTPRERKLDILASFAAERAVAAEPAAV